MVPEETVTCRMSKGKEEGLVETVIKKQPPNGFTCAKSHQDSFPNPVAVSASPGVEFSTNQSGIS